MKLKWVKSSDTNLPIENIFLLVKIVTDENTEIPNSNLIVAKLVKGLSIKDRQLMLELSLPDPMNRRYEYFSEDEYGGHPLSYCWETNTGIKYLPSEICEWAYIP